MKKLLALLVAAVMLCACVAAFAEVQEGQYTLYNVTGETLTEISLTNNDTGEKTVVATDVAADAVIDVTYSAEEGTHLTLAFTTESGYTGHFDNLAIEVAPISLLPETLVDAETHPTMIEFKALKLGQYALYNVTGETLKEITLTNNDTGDVTVVATDVAPDATIDATYMAVEGTHLTFAFTTESGYTGHFDNLAIETAPISMLAETMVDAETHPTMIEFKALKNGYYTLYNVTGETLTEISLTNNDTGEKTVVATDVAADAVIDATYMAVEGTHLTFAFTTESGYTGHFDNLAIETAPISMLAESAVDAETHPTMIDFFAPAAE